jgi:hypothetical protein
VIRGALALGLLALVVSGCNGGTVDKHALKRDSEKIGSLAMEGALLANDVSKGASTTYFVRVHAKEMSQSASDMQNAMATRPTSRGITDKVRQLSRLAGKVSAELERLHLHPTDRAVAASLKEPFKADADAADKLSK